MIKGRARLPTHALEAEQRCAIHRTVRVANALLLSQLATVIALIPPLLTKPALPKPQEPSKEQWGEKFNTAGARLVLKETERGLVSGRTVITYNLFVSGLPHDTGYIVWTRLIGRAAQPVAEAYLNGEGKVVSQLADPKRHTEEDPVNLRVVAGMAEPKQFALTSKDSRFRAFAEIVPFPIETSNGACHLSVVMTKENYTGVFIRVSGLQPQEDLTIVTQSDGEGGQSKAKASDLGMYDSALFPAVKGMRSGRARFSVTGKSCKVAIEWPWGDGSYKLQ